MLRTRPRPAVRRHLLTDRDRPRRRAGAVDRHGSDPEPDHGRRRRRLVAAGGARFAASICGARVDARRPRPDRQRRRAALAAADRGRGAVADRDRPAGLDRHQPRRLPRRPDAGLHLPGRSGWCPSGAVGRRGSPTRTGVGSTAGRPTARRLAFSADRGQGLDVYTIAPKDGRSESRLTADSHRRRRPAISRPTAAGSTSSPTAPAPATSGGCPPTAPGRATRRPSRSRPTTARTRHPTPRPTASGWSTSRTRPARPSTPWTATS